MQSEGLKLCLLAIFLPSASHVRVILRQGPKMENETRLSRRDLLQNLGGVVTVGALGASETPAASEPSRARPGSPAGGARVLALIGDRYHNSDYIRVSLDRLFGELGLPVDYTTNYDQLSRSLLDPYQLFVCFRDGMIWPGGYLGPDAYPYERYLENRSDFSKATPKNWITEEQGEAVKDFVAGGKGFYSLHNNSHVSLSSKNYREVMGGAYIGHPPQRPFKVRVVRKNHPITQGVQDFMVNDEQHYVTYDKDPKNIILRAENIDGLSYENLGTESIGGWAHEYGKGRVAFTAVGHNIHAMWQPQYFKLQKNAVRWLLKDGG
jgi:type 1 glutamine amidotransferase